MTINTTGAGLAIKVVRLNNRCGLSETGNELRAENLGEDTGTGGGICFAHNMFDVFFNSLLRNIQGIGNLFVGPALCQMLNYGVLPVG